MPEISGLNRAKSYIEGLDLSKKQGKAFLFFGPNEATAPLVNVLIEKLLPEGTSDFNLHKFDTETASPSSVAEALGSASLFPGRKAVLIKEPPFFAVKSKTAADWTDFFKFLEADKVKKAAAVLAALLHNSSVDPENAAEMSEAQLRNAADIQEEFDAARVRKFIQANLSLLQKMLSSGKADWSWLESWIKSSSTDDTALVVVAEKIDKRSKLFKVFKKYGILFNLAASSQREEKEQLRSFFARYAKETGVKFTKEAAALFLQKIGNDLGALKREMDKLSLSLPDGSRIVEIEHVNDLVTSHKIDELYELNEALGNKELASALTIIRKLLDQGFHPLAIYQGIANYLLKLFLLHQALAGIGQEKRPQMGSYSRFQREIMPSIKEYWEEGWPEILKKAHPYALFKMAPKALSFCTTQEFLGIIQALYHFDLALRSSNTPPDLVLESLILFVVKGDLQREK